MNSEIERLIDWAEQELKSIWPSEDSTEASAYWRGYIQALYDIRALIGDDDVQEGV